MQDSTNIDDFDYDLPEDKIPHYPLEKRDDAKLLVYSKGGIEDKRFKHIVDLLPTGGMLILNNTRVINARIFLNRLSGARVQLFLLSPVQPASMEQMMAAKEQATWKALVGGGKRWKVSESLQLNEGGIELKAERQSKGDETSEVEFSWNSDQTFGEVLEMLGNIPLPPYMQREAEESDKFRYQTTYAEVQGSVAAPTAGLHFSEQILSDLERKEVSIEKVTLHVGAGTFKPVSNTDYTKHPMHAEYIEVDKATLLSLRSKTFKVAVGTTSLRTLESLYWLAVALKNGREELVVHQWDPYQLDDPFESYEEALDYLLSLNLGQIAAVTTIMITPSYRIKSVDALITNFHLPKSTLLLLVSSAIGEDWKGVYKHALGNEYRFLSFGDSSFLNIQK